ncbi:phosphatidylglycerophosphatase A family protein [Sneathiella glossodoripedis]|uniref:phosphatidylglycerophosphatase A family protein n=1 Tax=Sneathiella glossodoripedis TaxID=418853 RepID=UPI00047224F0|nr:phosphatidylglycerophosphatase A [Sneathiella glossodoripedis]
MTIPSKDLSKLHPAVIFCTWFWSGLSPKAPGTMGSLAALPFGYLIMELGGQLLLLQAIVLVFVLGIWSTHVYVTKTGRQDPGEVVIDEVAGQWLPLLIAGANPIYYILAFLLFRVFDILKPWPISWMDKNIKGALGVMADDILAGLFALGALRVIIEVMT